MSEAGRMGGETRFENIGPEGMAEIGQKGGQNSWTTGHGKAPQLTDADLQREKQIRAKLERGEELTTEEAGFLGGVERVRQAGGQS